MCPGLTKKINKRTGWKDVEKHFFIAVGCWVPIQYPQEVPWQFQPLTSPNLTQLTVKKKINRQ